MRQKKVFALLLALVLALGSTPVFAAEAFTDVPEDAYYAEAVQWAVEQGITNGKGNGVFAPDDTVTRAEAVTFLWRMAGMPEPTQTETFADVKAGSWYETAVQWAVEQGIVNGTGNGNFSPSGTCSRGMILTMLYRMEGGGLEEVLSTELPENSDDWTLEDLGTALIQSFVEALRSEDGFTDVKEGAYYELPVFWAALVSILDENVIDTETMEVKPGEPCPRGEMVYFLYNDYKYKLALENAGEGYGAAHIVETGTVPETVVMDADGVKITLNSIENDFFGDPVLNLTVENSTDKLLYIDVSRLFVNTFTVSASIYIPTEDEYGTSYADVVAAPGETKTFCVGMNYLWDMDITAVYELELQMMAFEVAETEYGFDSVDDNVLTGEPVNVKTSLYDKDVSYDREGVVVCERDDLTVVVCKAYNHEYLGAQIMVYAYNRGSESVTLDVAELKLDGETYETLLGMFVPAGKRSVDTIAIATEGDYAPAAKEAELTLALLDEETWDVAETFDPVTVTFEE